MLNDRCDIAITTVAGFSLWLLAAGSWFLASDQKQEASGHNADTRLRGRSRFGAAKARNLDLRDQFFGFFGGRGGIGAIGIPTDFFYKILGDRRTAGHDLQPITNAGLF